MNRHMVLSLHGSDPVMCLNLVPMRLFITFSHQLQASFMYTVRCARHISTITATSKSGKPLEELSPHEMIFFSAMG